MCFTTILESRSEEATEALGFALGEVLRAGCVIALQGELGAGKTCLARGVVRGAMPTPTLGPLRVTSPTFTLINEYEGRIPIYHVDLYRISTVDELLEIGFEEILFGQGACLVEWFDRFPEEIPDQRLIIQLEATGDTTRQLHLCASGEQHIGLVRGWLERVAQTNCW